MVRGGTKIKPDEDYCYKVLNNFGGWAWSKGMTLQQLSELQLEFIKALLEGGVQPTQKSIDRAKEALVYKPNSAKKAILKLLQNPPPVITHPKEQLSSPKEQKKEIVSLVEKKEPEGDLKKKPLKKEEKTKKEPEGDLKKKPLKKE